MPGNCLSTGEQYFVAQNVVRLGAGECVHAQEYRNAIASLQLVLNDRLYSIGAESCAKKYADDRGESSIQRVLEILEGLAR